MIQFLLRMLALLWLGSLPFIAAAQILERQVVSPAGQFSATTAGSLDWTFGEPMTRFVSAVGADLCEGFQQGEYGAPVDANEPSDFADEAISLTAFPNPAAETVRLSVGAPVQLQLVDLNGAMASPVVEVDGFTDLDLSSLPAGLYIAVARNSSGQITGALKIQHIR